MSLIQNKKPIISVIMPSYNRAYCIERALNSLYKQTFKNFELIVIDNNSTDNTSEIVNKYKKKIKIFFYKINNNGIIAKSRNYGIKKSSGQYLAFLDTDDWWKMDKLQISLDYLIKGYDIVYHDLYSVYKKNNFFKNLWKIRTRKLSNPIRKDLLIYGNAINNSSVVLSKEIFLTIGGFSEDPNLISSEDYDAWIRFSKKTEKFKKIKKTLGYYWQGGGNTSNLNLTIKSMNHILKIYNDEIYKYSKDGSAGFNYTISRSYYNVSDFKNSIKYASKLIFKKVPLVLYCKSIITILQSILFYLIYVFKVKIF